MKIAYADPPYVGQAKKHYGCDEIDHTLLVKHLEEFDGWALSASSPSLGYLLKLTPPETRIAAWVKPFCVFKPNVNPAYAWEPVLFKVARRGDRTRPTVRDFISCGITLKKGLVGAKPEPFCYWLFDLLGAAPEDEFSDLYPGTGVVSRCWEQFKAKSGTCAT